MFCSSSLEILLLLLTCTALVAPAPVSNTTGATKSAATEACVNNDHKVENCFPYYCVLGIWERMHTPTYTPECCQQELDDYGYSSYTCEGILSGTSTNYGHAECPEGEEKVTDCELYYCNMGGWWHMTFYPTRECCQYTHDNYGYVEPICSDHFPDQFPALPKECFMDETMTSHCLVLYCVNGHWVQDTMSLTPECCEQMIQVDPYGDYSICKQYYPDQFGHVNTGCVDGETVTHLCLVRNCINGGWQYDPGSLTQDCCIEMMHAEPNREYEECTDFYRQYYDDHAAAAGFTTMG